jgi:hypothetical protein
MQKDHPKVAEAVANGQKLNRDPGVGFYPVTQYTLEKRKIDQKYAAN